MSSELTFSYNSYPWYYLLPYPILGFLLMGLTGLGSMSTEKDEHKWLSVTLFVLSLCLSIGCLFFFDSSKNVVQFNVPSLAVMMVISLIMVIMSSIRIRFLDVMEQQGEDVSLAKICNFTVFGLSLASFSVHAVWVFTIISQHSSKSSQEDILVISENDEDRNQTFQNLRRREKEQEEKIKLQRQQEEEELENQQLLKDLSDDVPFRRRRRSDEDDQEPWSLFKRKDEDEAEIKFM